jgi:hypothetical protein
MNAVTPPKLMPPFHRHPGQWHVADRAYEAQQGDDRADERAPDPGSQRVAGQEQVPPETAGYPGANCAGDQQPADYVSDDRRPFHHEDLAHRGVAAGAGQPLPESSAGTDAHFHGGVALHRPGQPLVGLPPSGFD